jgi:hypothetical protein
MPYALYVCLQDDSKIIVRSGKRILESYRRG